ncbi:hypothetical protein H5410_012406 [Solanum commersonii]|uniref:Uncharacterized protein n=1 Tax=Solanum commersonii TaxID=4109 RepID=A0A9J6AS28_SOLCO|nr:hypothetical protein H5410_012406 [Solanum commersonii]
MASSKLVNMNAGNAECSYASNSTLQRKVIQEAKPVLEDAIKKIGDFPKSCFIMADLSCKMPEFQAYLNDLPDNDFNTIFKSIPSFYRDLKDEASCFISGAPEKIENNNNIYIARTSPPHVIEAYMKQFDKDFSRFLQLRFEEIVTGGRMGHIEQAKLDSFNFPIYTPYKDEVEKIVQMEGSFDVDTIKFFKVNWDERDNDDDDDICFDAYSSGKHIARTMRAATEQMLVSHFELGDCVVDYLFERYAYHVACHLLIQKDKFFNIVLSLRNK